MRWSVATLTMVLALGLACAGGESAPDVDATDDGAADGGGVEVAPGFHEEEPEPEDEVADVDATRLQALVATSNPADVEGLLDGDPETTWTPVGDASGEGVLLRFERLERFDQVLITTCGDDANLEVYANGDSLGQRNGTEIPFDLPGEVKTLFVKVVDGAEVCLADIRLTTGLGPMAIAGPRRVEARVMVSSTLEPAAAYHETYLFDGRPHFAWVEGQKGSGEGESIQLTFRDGVTISAVELWNGYHRSDDHYDKNARIRKLEVEAEGRRVMLDVPEGRTPRRIDIDPPISARVMTLTVAAAKRGSAYEDLVVSELRFHDRQGPFTITPMEDAKLRQKLAKQLSGKPLAEVVDKTWRQVCGGERQLKLRGDHSFVYYEQVEDADSERQLVLDGAWSPAKKGRVKLYARRHVAEKTFNPYGGGGEVDATEIAGGALQVDRLSDLGMEAAVEKIKAWTKGGARDRVACLMEGNKLDLEKVRTMGGDVVMIEGKAITDLMVHRP